MFILQFYDSVVSLETFVCQKKNLAKYFSYSMSYVCDLHSSSMILIVSPLMLMILFRKLTKPTLPHSNQQTKASFKTSEINHNTKDLQSTGIASLFMEYLSPLDFVSVSLIFLPLEFKFQFIFPNKDLHDLFTCS